MEQHHSSTPIAGIDVGKHRLDVALSGSPDEIQLDNSPHGLARLLAWLRARHVTRVGLEATGGYERAVRAGLEAAGLEVVVHQPIEVRLFARLKRWRAKTDRLDARLIAAATAQVETVRAAQDPRLPALAEHLSAYEQVSDQAAQLKTFLESVACADIAALIQGQIQALVRLKARLLAVILRRIRAEPDLLRRFRLLLSLPGIGPVVAASLVIRMPELGGLRRGQAAALIGVAPFACESGTSQGLRRIAGGRARPRRLLYLAALAAKRCDPGLKAFAQGLQGRGKAAKVITVALMRKLIEAANLVLQRQQPWIPKLQP
jgi:transposase